MFKSLLVARGSYIYAIIPEGIKSVYICFLTIMLVKVIFRIIIFSEF